MLAQRDIEAWRVRMRDADRTVATVLQHWLKHERLKQVDVARAAGMSRQHLGQIVTGRIRRPSPPVLRTLAAVIATDSDGAVDEQKRRAILSELGAAADFEDLDAAAASDALRAAIMAAGADPRSAAFHEWFIRTYPTIGPMHQEVIRLVFELVGKRGGDLRAILLDALDGLTV